MLTDFKSIAAGAFIFFSITHVAQGATSHLSDAGERAIKEAENLSLLKDRLPACTALIRTIKKSDKSEQKILKEKLGQLSRYFYTDKGFQDFLAGKDYFEKQKFSDAAEKFIEADELENGNIDVLNYLLLAQIWLKQTAATEVTLKRALQINPFDIEIFRDDLSLSLISEDWVVAAKKADILISQLEDSTLNTLQSRSIALFQSGTKGEALKLMNQVATKDSTLPEPQYWLAVMSNSTKTLNRYIELCEKKPVRFVMRDPSTCTHVTEAQKMLALEAPKPTPIKESL